MIEQAGLRRYRLMRLIYETDPEWYKAVSGVQILDTYFDFENPFWNGPDTAPTLKPYTPYGGYPLYYQCTDTFNDYPEFACAACASSTEDGRVCVDGAIHYEGEPIICDFCNAEIESAYGVPEREDES